MNNTPSAEQALMFDQYVQQWQQTLSLGDWRIERGMKSAKNAMASVEFNAPARLAVYRLGDWGSEAITPQSLERTALHELLHILLHDLIDVASNPRADHAALETAEHRIINVLERVLTREGYGIT